MLDLSLVIIDGAIFVVVRGLRIEEISSPNCSPLKKAKKINNNFEIDEKPILKITQFLYQNK